jgi:hypothetical protein
VVESQIVGAALSRDGTGREFDDKIYLPENPSHHRVRRCSRVRSFYGGVESGRVSLAKVTLDRNRASHINVSTISNPYLYLIGRQLQSWSEAAMSG